ncbi:MAG TPA: hypothetical protein ENN40_09580 [Candidatus Aminicenantes bacterium]|nr:hypothetical protein [Candidatus Aminicenantes bacterium]
MQLFRILFLSLCLAGLAGPLFPGPDEPEQHPDGCTSITVGRLASTDGSVMTSHTCDSHKDRTWIDVVPASRYPSGSMRPVFSDSHLTRHADDLSRQSRVGTIPQVKQTYSYINTALPCLNEKQVAIGEATFGGKAEMRSDQGIIDYYELNRIMLERATSARHAIRIADEITKEYGYNDGGECFTIADPQEVWHLEIVGPGKGGKGAVWAAQRVPDGHVSVNANASRIRQIHLDRPDEYMASANVVERAIEMGLFDPQAGQPFEFCYAYAHRRSMAARRREWRVLSLLAPGLKLDPNSENHPFSVQPEAKVSPGRIMEIFRDTYEGTPFDMTKFMLVPETKKGERTGRFIKSPYANPFMDYDMMPLFAINGGWNELGERCIARYYCTYATVIQVRSWLPDPIGGLAWVGYDNPAMTAYAPIYAGIESFPAEWRVCGRSGFNRQCAWWAFNRVADLAAQKWGHMREDVAAVRNPLEKEVFASQADFEERMMVLHKKTPRRLKKALTRYSQSWMKRLTDAYWKLGDDIWTKYTGKF